MKSSTVDDLDVVMLIPRPFIFHVSSSWMWASGLIDACG